jgi:hypothetical protein
MKRMIALAFCLTFLAVQGWTQIQQYTIQYTSTSPTIDGVRTAGEWDAAATAASGFKVLRTTPPGSTSPEGISWQAMVDDQAIYLIVETTFVGLTGSADFADDALPTGDDLEIFFSPNRNSEPNVPPATNTDPRVEDSYQIIVSLAPGTWHRVAADAGPPGLFTLARYDALFGDNVTGSWDPQGLEFGVVSSASTGAVAEFKIPFADLNAQTSTLTHMDATSGPANGEVWQWNIGRITSNSNPLDQLPIWNYHAGTNDPATGAGAFFAEREFGEVTFQVPDSSLLEDFDDFSEWTLSFFDSGVDSGTVENDTTIKTQGTGSLKITYNYAGNQWYNMLVTKTLAAPVDLSSAKEFRFQMYGDSAAATDLIYVLRLYSTNGHTWRYVGWGGIGEDGWREVVVNIADMTTDYWFYDLGPYLDNPDITEIEKIEIDLQQTGTATANTAVIYLDDLHFYTTNDLLAINTLDDFNYTDDPALNAAWATTIPAGGYALDLATTTTAIEGMGMQMDYTIVDYWTNVRATKTLDAVTDFSDVDFFKVWIKGDPSIADKSPVMLFTLQDTSGRRTWAHLRSGLKKDGWTCYFLEFTPDDGAVSGLQGPFHQDSWDPDGNAGDCDITQVEAIALFTQGSVQFEAYDFTVVVDLVQEGYDTALIPTAAKDSWLLYR